MACSTPAHDRHCATPPAATRLRSVRMRPIAPGDLPQLRRFARGLSRETAYKRLLSGRTPGEEELQRWCAVDRPREEAIVAIAPAEGGCGIAGVARFVQVADGDADVAIVLADAWQGLGLGRLLMTALVASAKEHGLRSLTGMTLSSNHAMLSLARSLGFRTTRLADASTTRIHLDLAPTEPPAQGAS